MNLNQTIEAARNVLLEITAVRVERLQGMHHRRKQPNVEFGGAPQLHRGASLRTTGCASNGKGENE